MSEPIFPDDLGLTAALEVLEAPGDESPEGPRSVWYAERRARLAAALDGLPAEQRQVVQQAFFLGMSQREIAEANRIPLGTVKTRTLLAMRKLRESLREEKRELL